MHIIPWTTWGRFRWPAWVQATPNNGDRFSTVLGRGDPSYRISMDGTSTTLDDLWHFAYGGAGDQVVLVLKAAAAMALGTLSSVYGPAPTSSFMWMVSALRCGCDWLARW